MYISKKYDMAIIKNKKTGHLETFVTSNHEERRVHSLPSIIYKVIEINVKYMTNVIK